MRSTTLHGVSHSSDTQRAGWLAKMQTLAAKDVGRVTKQAAKLAAKRAKKATPASELSPVH